MFKLLINKDSVVKKNKNKKQFQSSRIKNQDDKNYSNINTP